MDAQGWVAIIAAIGMALGQLVTVVFAALAWYKGKIIEIKSRHIVTTLIATTAAAEKAEAESKERDTAIQTAVIAVKDEINGRMGDLLRVTAEAERAKGIKDEQDRKCGDS